MSPRRKRKSVALSILSHLQSRQTEMVDFLRRLTLIETPSLSVESQEPAFVLLADFLKDVGYRVRRLHGKATGGQIYAVPVKRTRRSGAQLLLGHVDTVWPVGTLAHMPVELKEGRLTGPGVYDMKGGLTQALFAISALHELKLTPSLTPVLFVNSDEEVFSFESVHHIKRLARHVQRVFVLEPSLGTEGRLKTRRKGFGCFTVTVRGKAAHAGLEPELGASAILEMAHVIQYLHRLSDLNRGVTVNVGFVQGGLRGNVIAPEASAEVDVRVFSNEDNLRIERALAGLRPFTPGTQIEISNVINRPPLERTDRNQALYKEAKRAAQDLGIDLDEGTAGGGSDGSITSIYSATLDGLGAVGDGAHAAHEFVYTHCLPERTALIAALLLTPPLTRFI